MQQREKLKYLEGEIAKGINKMKLKGDQNKSRTFIVRISSALLGAFVTIALGLQTTSLTTELKNFALICGALISVVNTLDSIAGYRALWVKQKLTLSQLYTLRNEIEFYKAGLEENDTVDEAKVQEFFAKYQSIWETASNEWLRLRKEQEQEEGEGNR
ncbi:MAG: hypothetical protein DDG60_02190 [Anaerolineae bacterium]|nr:MAG: hypothetical protein DDG60_02190 [Anaerolineae bacterium]